MAPTTFCDAPHIGFANANNEDQYISRSVSARTSDGLIVDGGVQTVGKIHVCFGPSSDPDVVNFYGEGELGAVAFRGLGECALKRNYPESNLIWSRCFLDLSGLPALYIGGRLTTNSINSPKSLIGEKTDPPGYVQNSIATMRLWKKRP